MIRIVSYSGYITDTPAQWEGDTQPSVHEGEVHAISYAVCLCTHSCYVWRDEQALPRDQFHGNGPREPKFCNICYVHA